MSAIQEERMSALQGSSIRPTTTMTSFKESKNSCDTSPTTSSSSSDSSPDQPRPVCPAPTPAFAPVIAGETVKSRLSSESTTAAGAAKTTTTKPLKVVENPSSTTVPKPPTRTSKARSTPLLSQASMAGAKALRSLRARAPGVPRFDGSGSASSTSSSTSEKTPPKKKTKAQSVRSRPKAELVDHLLNEAVKQSAPTKYPLDLTALKGGRELPSSQPALCFEDLLASKAACQPTTEKRKPCVVDLRSGTSSTTAAPGSNKQSGHFPVAAKDNFAAAKSSVDLVFKQAKQTHSRRHLSDDHERMRGRASSDGGQMSVDIPILGDTIRARPRASSDSVSIPLLQRTKEPYARLRHYEGTFKNRRGQSLLYFSLFPPEKLAMRAVIVHLHGMGDHCRRSTALYERFCKAGFGVITYDLLNHGVSDCDRYKMRAHISNFDHFVDDTNDFITFAKSKIYKDALRYWRKHHHPRHPHGKEKRRRAPPELPLIISGASFGSLIGLHTVLAGEHKFHAAFWASPTIGVTWTKVLWAQWKFARPLVAAFPTAKVIPAIQHSLRSRDPEFLKRYHEDPMTISDMITPLSGHQSLHAMMRLQHDRRVADGDSPFCGVPMLFLAGSVDRISDQQAAYKFYNQMGSLDKDFKLFDGLYHMIYEEPEKEEVFEYLVDWLHRRFRLETRHRVEP
uniref:Serine aminopeptidase S33 domain-containing protein n=1 Tax=Hyaloperonospora arabidopsidis (strain Emoy2) TaxID=559515 RepID=M4BKJ6_HYAAE